MIVPYLCGLLISLIRAQLWVTMSVGLRVRVKGGKLDINLAIIIKAALAGGALLSAFNVSLGYLAGGVNGAISALVLNLAYMLVCV